MERLSRDSITCHQRNLVEKVITDKIMSQPVLLNVDQNYPSKNFILFFPSSLFLLTFVIPLLAPNVVWAARQRALCEPITAPALLSDLKTVSLSPRLTQIWNFLHKINFHALSPPVLFKNHRRQAVSVRSYETNFCGWFH